ncbi:MAG: hypothetical protein GXO80_02350 [Chlorobi bacterium]|nr:hypothetical protein [Chlorobiota bacterium]
MKQAELQALISLLDDKDTAVYQAVREKLLLCNESVIPDLAAACMFYQNDLLKERANEIISQLQFKKLDEDFAHWIKNDKNLLYGTFLIAKYQYPELKYEDVENKLNKIVSDLRADINLYLTGLQQIRKINHALYDIHRFSPDFSDIINPENSFLNKVLENKKSNDILIAVVYIYISQKLGLPVYGVDFPRNFLLMFKDERSGDALFYINPFNKGAIVTKNDIQVFLKNHKLKQKNTFFTSCSNTQIIKRLLNFLMNFYIRKKNKNKTEEIKRILNLF